VNSVPHIGHSFEFILGDSISKYFKYLKGKDVHFNVGLDEHGIKVYEKSNILEISPKEHIENLTKLWKEFCFKFEIEYDSFYKTSDYSHHENVKKIWNNFLKNGDIYKDLYQGKYCKGCESDKKDSELVDGKCTDHINIEIELVNEENYFFKLSKYKNILYDWINNHSEFIEPKSKIEELKNIIKTSSDISISRLKSKCPWGIEVPNDNEHIIYVWFDALLNYIFAAGYLTDNFKWDNIIQICGPDNLRFQALIFQAFLEAEGIKKTDKLLVHGTILDKNGQKISKSIGNVIDPIEQLNKYGLEPVRYYTIAGLNTYSNSSWDEEELKSIWNNQIVNEWGNLISRVLHLVDIKSANLENKDIDFLNQLKDFENDIDNLWCEFKVKDALKRTNELVKFANKYINYTKPWKIDNCDVVLSNLKSLLVLVNRLYLPVFGVKRHDEILAIIELGKKNILFSIID